MYWKNSGGRVFRSDSGGTYPVNDGNPENDDDKAPDDIEPDWDSMIDEMRYR